MSDAQDHEAVDRRPFNRVILGNRKKALLLPVSSWNRIWHKDGYPICNHGDGVDCTRSDHETVTLYEIVDQDDRRYWPERLTPEQIAASTHTPAVSILERARKAEAEVATLTAQLSLERQRREGYERALRDIVAVFRTKNPDPVWLMEMARAALAAVQVSEEPDA